MVVLKPTLVIARLERLGIRRELITSHKGLDAVKVWVRKERDFLATETLTQLTITANLTGSELLFVTSGDMKGVVSMQRSIDGADVTVVPNPPGQVVHQPCRTAELLELAVGAKRLFVAIDGRLIPIVDFEIRGLSSNP